MMPKRFKLKLCSVIPSFQTCRSKDKSNLPSNPVPSFIRLSPISHSRITLYLPQAPPSQPSNNAHHSSIKRQVSSAINSTRSDFRSRSSTADYLSQTDHAKSQPQQEFQWEKEEKWHVVAKIHDESHHQKNYSSSFSRNESNHGNVLLPPPSPANTAREKRVFRKKKTASNIRMSTSSATDNGLYFSSEDVDNDDEVNDAETETLVSSSGRFSSDSSSEFNPHLQTIREAPFNRKKKAKRGYVVRNRSKATRNARKSSGCEPTSPARLSRFQWLIPCTVEGKVRESFAVVKKSEDPREDFKRSMMEMIIEKQMFEEEDLEQLLHCFLSLNSSDHHGAIVQAFSETWEALFCQRSVVCT